MTFKTYKYQIWTYKQFWAIIECPINDIMILDLHRPEISHPFKWIPTQHAVVTSALTLSVLKEKTSYFCSYQKNNMTFESFDCFQGGGGFLVYMVN